MRISLLTRYMTQNWISRIGLDRGEEEGDPLYVGLTTIQPLQRLLTNKKNQHNFYGTSSRIVLVRFLEELKVTERHFENNQPFRSFQFFQNS